MKSLDIKSVDAQRTGTFEPVVAARMQRPSSDRVVARARTMSRTGKTQTAAVEDVAAWIDAHLGEHITLEDLCEIAGVGARCLQKHFRARSDASPMEVVLARRLAAARARLLRSDAGCSVTSVAHDCGFAHMGRFSRQYRLSYGESPSETLLRSASTGQQAFDGAAAGPEIHNVSKGRIR
jgi:transcriptional regulator GlxA family with amidase domain